MYGAQGTSVRHNLTDRQRAVLNWIVMYIEEVGYPPAIREIGEQFAIGSLRGVTVHLDALAKKGYISRSNTPRSIRILFDPDGEPHGKFRYSGIITSISTSLDGDTALLIQSDAVALHAFVGQKVKFELRDEVQEF